MLSTAQLRQLLTLYEKSNDFLTLLAKKPAAPLDANVRNELADLQRRSIGEVPEFVLPSAEEAVSKYMTVRYYNIVYRSSDVASRDCFVGCDVKYRGKTRRVYGEILFFLSLRLKDHPAQSFVLAYVDWFHQTIGDPLHLTRRHSPASTLLDRAVPISQIVCKAALVPLSAQGQKCAVVELLWYVPREPHCAATHFLHRAENTRKTKLRTILFAAARRARLRTPPAHDGQPNR